MDEKNELEKNSTPSDSVTEVIPDIEIPTLRTYKNDINQTVNKDHITTAKILMAEQKRTDVVQAEKKQTSVKRPLNFIALLFGITCIVAAIGIFGYFGYTKVVKQAIDSVIVQESFLFIFDKEKFIDVSKNKTEVYSLVDTSIQEVGSETGDETYTDIIFYKDNAETKEKTRITSTEFFELYDIELPTNIARSISKDFIYGIYKTQGKAEPFLVVGLVDFENAYDSMFVWEKTLALDIKDIFPILKNLFDISKQTTILTPEVVATSTATTTIKATSTATTTKSATTTPSTLVATSTLVLTPEQEFEKQNEMREVINRTIRFVDIVLYNRDVRGVRDTNGNPFFYYSFIDRNKILFAQDPKIVNEINKKIKEKQLVR